MFGRIKELIIIASICTSRYGVSELELTPSQQVVVRAIPERLAPERIDHLWIFPAHVGKRVETGLFVVSLAEEGSRTGRDAGARRELYTFRYRTELGARRPAPVIDAQEEGRTSLERIERVIAGVLARAGEAGGEPELVALAGSPAAWGTLLARAGVQLDGAQ